MYVICVRASVLDGDVVLQHWSAEHSKTASALTFPPKTTPLFWLHTHCIFFFHMSRCIKLSFQVFFEIHLKETPRTAPNRVTRGQAGKAEFTVCQGFLECNTESEVVHYVASKQRSNVM